MKFYLGTHKEHWLRTAGFPLFVSHRRLMDRRSLPEAVGPWVLDSGGFTELGKFGEWRTTPEDYVKAVRRYQDEIGRLEWAAPQDWMCEPKVRAMTGLTVEDHQRRTVENLLVLRDLDPGLPIRPVIQGWERDDYLRCLDLYEAAGVDLREEPIVGVGSVCRRQATSEIETILRDLSGAGVRLHGFGVKIKGLRRYADALVSADSMAWSFHARLRPPLPGHTHKNCANCWDYAIGWRDRVLAELAA